MIWNPLDTWIVITGACFAMACAIPGVYLVLNRDSMLGDAISHAVLPGVALAFLLTNSRDPWVMLIGALIAGVLTGVLSTLIQRWGQVESGAALGVTFCTLFAMGLILIRIAADHVDLDPSCVLYGEIETAVLDVSPIPQITWIAAGMLATNLSLMLFFYKELRLATFDPHLATTLGFPAGAIRQGIIIATSITTVMAFQAVGSILVIAMFVVPVATASLLTRRLGSLILGSLSLAALSALLGHWAAISLFPDMLSFLLDMPHLGSTSSAGMMATTAGTLFLFVFLARLAFFSIQNSKLLLK